MRMILGFLAGAAIAIVNCLLVGVGSIQASGSKSGAVYDLNNTVVAVTEPRLPILSSLSIVASSALCVAVIVILASRYSPGARACVRLGYSVLGVIAIVMAYSMMDVPPEGFLEGWRGWVVEGGSLPVFQLCVVAAVVSLLMGVGRRARAIEVPSF